MKNDATHPWRWRVEDFLDEHWLGWRYWGWWLWQLLLRRKCMCGCGERRR